MDWDVAWIVVAAGVAAWWISSVTRTILTERAGAQAATNPYHAVAIRVGGKGCERVAQLANRRFISSEAPLLPLRGCTAAACRCAYVHYDDRRAGERRVALWPGAAFAHVHGAERRVRQPGRRGEDLLGVAARGLTT